jgi:hypothetical protein
MSKRIAHDKGLKESKEFRDEVQGMIDRYQNVLRKLEDEDREGPAGEDGAVTYRRESIQDYIVILTKLQGLLDNLDHTIQKYGEQSKGGN